MTGTPTALLAVLASALVLAGCLGSDEPESTRVTGSEATVMASLPQDGVSAAAAAAVEAGARLALADAGGRAGEPRSGWSCAARPSPGRPSGIPIS